MRGQETGERRTRGRRGTTRSSETVQQAIEDQNRALRGEPPAGPEEGGALGLAGLPDREVASGRSQPLLPEHFERIPARHPYNNTFSRV